MKRRLNTSESRVSPPPVRRRKISDVTSNHRPLNDSLGHLSTGPKPEAKLKPSIHTIKIYSWNVNGISPLLTRSPRLISNFFVSAQSRLSTDASQSANLYPLRLWLATHHYPAFLCLQEVHISPSDTATQQLVAIAANYGRKDNEPGYVVELSLPRDKFNARGLGDKARVHGVATLVRNDLSTGGRKVEISTTRPEWDLEGRVLVHNITVASTLPDSTHPVEGPRNHSTGTLSIEFDDVANEHWSFVGSDVQHNHNNSCSSQHFAGIACRTISLMNGYWPNGTTHPYRSPVDGSDAGTRHDFKRKFHRLMLELCSNFRAQDRYVLLVGDMNIAPARIDGYPNLRTKPIEHVINRADFNKKFLEVIPTINREDIEVSNSDAGIDFRGIDLFRHFHDQRRKYTYFGPGPKEDWGKSCDRVDLAVADAGLVGAGAIVGMDICDSFEERGKSDHVPLWVEIDLSKLLNR